MDKDQRALLCRISGAGPTRRHRLRKDRRRVPACAGARRSNRRREQSVFSHFISSDAERVASLQFFGNNMMDAIREHSVHSKPIKVYAFLSSPVPPSLWRFLPVEDRDLIAYLEEEAKSSGRDVMDVSEEVGHSFPLVVFTLIRFLPAFPRPERRSGGDPRITSGLRSRALPSRCADVFRVKFMRRFLTISQRIVKGTNTGAGQIGMDTYR